MLVYDKKLNVGIINADVFRVAAQEHLNAYCEILKTDCITIYSCLLYTSKPEIGHLVSVIDHLLAECEKADENV